MDRFWQKVNVTPTCWLWTASQNSDGYGVFSLDARTLRAHRVSWTLHAGKIPEGLCVLHSCDVRNCVRPAHLFLGTQRDNMVDASQKGRLEGSIYHIVPRGP